MAMADEYKRARGLAHAAPLRASPLLQSFRFLLEQLEPTCAMSKRVADADP